MSEKLPKRLALFDLDGTLTQTFHANDPSFTRALSKLIDIDPHYDYTGEVQHPTDEAVFYALFKKINGTEPTLADREAMIDLYLQELMHTYYHKPGFFDEIPGANELLHELHHSDQWVVAIATGAWQRVAQLKLELAGIHYQHLPLFTSDLFPDKRRFTQMAIETVGKEHQLSQITYIGDSNYDYQVSRELGIQFVGIDYRGMGHLNHLSFCPIYPDLRYVVL